MIGDMGEEKTTSINFLIVFPYTLLFQIREKGDNSEIMVYCLKKCEVGLLHPWNEAIVHSI